MYTWVFNSVIYLGEYKFYGNGIPVLSSCKQGENIAINCQWVNHLT